MKCSGARAVKYLMYKAGHGLSYTSCMKLGLGFQAPHGRMGHRHSCTSYMTLVICFHAPHGASSALAFMHPIEEVGQGLTQCIDKVGHELYAPQG
jgi:hypothetical protein